MLAGDTHGRRIEVEGSTARAAALPEGRWRVRVTGRRVSQVEREFDVKAEHTTRLELELSECGEFRLRIVDERVGAPEPHCWLRDDATKATVWHSGPLVREGNTYLAYPCAPPGRYTLVCWANQQLRSEQSMVFTGEADEGESTLILR
jgi:hypothetical protein